MTANNPIAIFERVFSVLKTIESTPIATATDVHKEALSHVSHRSAQRYLKSLEDAGYIRHVGGFGDPARYFLTDKCRELFESVLGEVK